MTIFQFLCSAVKTQFFSRFSNQKCPIDTPILPSWNRILEPSWAILKVRQLWCSHVIQIMCDILVCSHVMQMCCDWSVCNHVIRMLCCDWLVGSHVIQIMCCDWSVCSPVLYGIIMMAIIWRIFEKSAIFFAAIIFAATKRTTIKFDSKVVKILW